MKRYTFVEAIERLSEIIEGMEVSELIELHNAVCDSLLDTDGIIYRMDEFNDICNSFGYEPIDIANMIHHGEFNPWNEFFKFDPYQNLFSFNTVGAVVDTEEIISTIMDQEDAFGFQEIQAVLDNYDGE